MNKRMVLSAFADEYADNLIEQCQELNNLGISYMEMRGVNGKNVSVLSKTEVREAKKVLADYGIKVSSIGSPLGKIKLDGDLDGHLETAKRVLETANELGAKNIRKFSFYTIGITATNSCYYHLLTSNKASTITNSISYINIFNKRN